MTSWATWMGHGMPNIFNWQGDPLTCGFAWLEPRVWITLRNLFKVMVLATIGRKHRCFMHKTSRRFWTSIAVFTSRRFILWRLDSLISVYNFRQAKSVFSRSAQPRHYAKLIQVFLFSLVCWFFLSFVNLLLIFFLVSGAGVRFSKFAEFTEKITKMNFKQIVS